MFNVGVGVYTRKISVLTESDGGAHRVTARNEGYERVGPCRGRPDEAHRPAPHRVGAEKKIQEKFCSFGKFSYVCLNV